MTQYHATLIDETGCEFGATIDIDDGVDPDPDPDPIPTRSRPRPDRRKPTCAVLVFLLPFPRAFLPFSNRR